MSGACGRAVRRDGPRLVACVASHGWGHLSQTVPIVEALHRRLPALEVVVRTGLPAAVVRARFEARGLPAPEVRHDDTEFGFVMHDALRIDLPASLARYAMLFAERDARLAHERDALRDARCDAVLANVGWLPIAAAASLGVPAWGVCSLNWADVLDACAAGRPGVAPIVAWMRDAYARADAVFALEPGMPFEAFANRVSTEPIARLGTRRPESLRAAIGAPPDARLLLVAFGGIPMRIDTARWRMPAGWHAIATFDGVTEHETVHDAARLDWDWLDVVASVDAMVAKPGYGTFAEAGFAARDTLVVPRDDWPESPHLARWLARHARTTPIALDAVRAGAFDAALAAIDAQTPRTAARGDGATRIAEAIAMRLG